MILIAVIFAGLVVGAVAERLVAPGGATVARGTGPSTPGPAAPDRARRPRRPRDRRRLVGRFALLLVVAVLLSAVGGYLWARSVFDRIDKVDVSAALSDGPGTNYLLVGADNAIGDGEQREGVQGVRSDTIMVLHVEGGGAKMLSLNRDLWVDNPATGQPGRLNATYNQGPENLVRAVTQNFGIPIERYIEIDFNSFSGLVDSFGGIDVHFEHPAFDLASGLDVKEAGLVHLDGAQALAYVRSRHYHEMIDGQPRPEGGLPDVNRTMRQQTFLRGIMNKASDNKNPFKLMSAAGKMAGGLRIDDDMTMLDAARFAWSMGSLDPQPVPLPVVPRTTSGGAAVLELGSGADEVLDQFR
jgi:LCP family protein required for cell wall assembly